MCVIISRPRARRKNIQKAIVNFQSATMPNGCPSLFLSAFPSILPSPLRFAQPHNKSSGLILHTAYAGQRHVPSFTGAGWETTVCLTHIHAINDSAHFSLFWGLCKKDFVYVVDWRTQNADVFLEHAHTVTCFLTPTLQAWLQPHDASTKQRRYLLLYEQQREFFLSFFWWRKNNIWGL